MNDLKDLIRQGSVLFKEGKLDMAEKVFANVLSREPDEIHALKYMGIINLKLGDKVSARDYFLKITTFQDDADAYYFLGEIYNENNEFDNALTSHKKSFSADPLKADIIGKKFPFKDNYDETVINCILCGSDNYKTAWVGNQSSMALNYGVINPLRTWVKCSECGFIFANPCPTEKALNLWWHHYSVPKKDMRSWKYFSSDVVITKNIEVAASRIKTIQKYCGIGKLFEIGASVGIFLATAIEVGWDAAGIELMENAVEAAKSFGIEILCGDFLKSDLGKGDFDAIAMWEVVEHTIDPKAFLLKANDMLKRGGIIALSTPNPESAFVRFKGKAWDLWKEPTHAHYFTPVTMKRLFLETGFELLEYTQSPSHPWCMDVYGRKI
ncbi:MAG TPA: hypothetical protein DCP24_03565 [Nitrospiraceae bacterium]|nr:hypothetical protein [Nitrospiraceae bacterium]